LTFPILFSIIWHTEISLRNLCTDPAGKGTAQAKSLFPDWIPSSCHLWSNILSSRTDYLSWWDKYCSRRKNAYPVFSLKKVITANPDVIIVPTMEKQTQAIKAFWAKFSQISAVRNNRVYIVNSDFFDRPSLRMVEALKCLIKLLHTKNP